MSEARKMLTLKQVAEQLLVSERTVWALVKRGELAVIRIGRQIRVRPADLDAYLEQARVPSTAEQRRAAIRALPNPPAKRTPLPEGYWRR